MNTRLLTLTAILIYVSGLLANENLAELKCERGSVPTPDSPEYRRYARDREMDILHLALDITPDFKQRTLSGQATLTFKPLGKPLREVTLDGVDLSVSSVTASEKVQAYEVTEKNVIVTFEKPIEVGKETTLHIFYKVQPTAGLYFRTPEMGYREDEMHLWTQGEAEDHRHWYPSYDYPNEKFSSEITCHVPAGMTVLSNGKLVSEEKDANGFVAVHWKQEKPHVNYLLTLVAGYFKKVEDRYRDIPLAFYVPPSEINEAKNSFRTTKDNMEFFEKEIGVPYPWEKYYQVVVRDFIVGGMENTSVTTLTERTLFSDEFENVRNSEGLVAHELAHQWFGDLVTCKDWSHIWLNEGFATYYALLYDGHKNGRDSMLYGLWQTSRSVLTNANELNPTNAPRAIVSRKYEDPQAQFGYLAYPKGACVLRMLESQLGEDLYRSCIKTYLERHQFDSVVTEDLNEVVEELSGRSFDQFFDQWVYHAHYPELDVDYNWDEKTRTAKVSVKQTQKISEDVLLFKTPLKVRFHSKSGDIDREMAVKQKEEDFYFSLEQKPEFVLIDPDLELLVRINFKLPGEMLHAVLAAKDNVVGKFFALEKLAEKKDHDTIARLKQVLNSDPFFGVRIEAAKALQTIHTEEALDALIASQKQNDARVRKQVVASIGAFFEEAAFAQMKSSLSSEKNPDIVAQAIRSLGASPRTEVKETILKFLETKSYRNVLADAAITAMRLQDDATYIPALKSALQKYESTFPARSFAGALDALAYLTRNEQNKNEVRNFLLSYVNHKREGFRVGAINALGTLEDPKATSLLETFAGAAKETPERAAAEKSLATIRAAKKPTDNLNELRSELLELKKQQRETSKELDALKKKLDGQTTKATRKK